MSCSRVRTGDHSHPAARGHRARRRRPAHRRHRDLRVLQGRHVGGRRRRGVQADLVALVRHVRPRPRVLPPARAGDRAGPVAPPGASARADARCCRRSSACGLVLVTVVLLAILAISPLIAADYFDGDWVMVIALMASFAAYAPAIIARGICSGIGPLQRLRHHHRQRRRRAHRHVRRPRRPRHRGRRRLRLRRRPGPARRPRLRRLPRRAAHRGRSGGDVEGGHAEPRLAAPRLGVRRRPPQRRPDRHHDARRARPGRAGHAVRLRRAARPHPAVHVPGRAGRAAPPPQPAWPPAASSASSAPG